MQQRLAIVKVLKMEHADVIMRIGPLRPDAPLAAQVVYSDKAKIEAMVRRSMPMLKNFSEFEYGFKVRDKSRPKDWYFPENITLIPREKELRGTVVDQVSDWWKKTTGGGK